MTKKEFEKIEKTDGFDAAMDQLLWDTDCTYITTEEILQELAINKITEYEYVGAIEILNALDENQFMFSGKYWYYDECSAPTPIRSIDDIIDLLDDENDAEYFTDYYKAKKRAEELDLKEAEYGDKSNGVAYCYWNKTGNRNDAAIVYVEYCWGKDGKPIPLEGGGAK